MDKVEREIKSITFKIVPNGKLKIGDNSFEIMNQYRQYSQSDMEAGGMLLGRFIIESEDIVIDYVTTPMKHDKRKRTFFHRSNRGHKGILKKIWKQSNGTCNYIGEWHTHPELIPFPSEFDFEQWKKILKKTKCDCEKLFFIVVGLKSVRAWQGNILDKSIIELEAYYSIYEKAE